MKYLEMEIAFLIQLYINYTSMRNMLVTHLRENALHYRGFVSSAVPANNSNVYNADTVAPDEYDGYISLMSDYKEQSQFRWERCIGYTPR